MIRSNSTPVPGRSTGLVDLLDRVLDKGLVIAGDIRVSLAEVELLTIRIRLIVCSLDKAKEIGLNWWRYDRYFSAEPGNAEREDLRRQVRDLERKVAALTAGRPPRAILPEMRPPRTPRRASRRRGGPNAR